METKRKKRIDQTFDDRFNHFCAEKLRTSEEVEEYLKSVASHNQKRFLPGLNKRAELFAKIHRHEQIGSNPNGRSFDIRFEIFCAEKIRSKEEVDWYIETNGTDDQIKNWRDVFQRRNDAFVKCHIVSSKNSQDFEHDTSEDLKSETVYPDELDKPETLFEGIKKTVLVNSYERNPMARKKCIEHYGAKCAVPNCGFDFEEVYGDIGKGFIHVHHLTKLSDIGQGYVVNPIKDLRPVCPNCHAMLHQKNPPYTINELRLKKQN
ncbi:MAG: hypothetical protein WAW61_08415 [Methylococcaceae bacterium]